MNGKKNFLSRMEEIGKIEGNEGYRFMHLDSLEQGPDGSFRISYPIQYKLEKIGKRMTATLGGTRRGENYSWIIGE